jgi:hypothetical protein
MKRKVVNSMNHTKDTLQNRSDFGAFIPAFLDDYPLESEEFRLYAHIQRRAGGQGCFESIPKMAQHCYMALKTAKNALKLLLATGMVTIEERPGTTNIYTLTPASEWVKPEQVNLLREQIKTKKLGRVKNDPSQICTGGKNDPSQKDMGSRVKFAPPSGVKNAWGVGSNLTHEGIPIKDIPVKELPLKDAPLASPPAHPHPSSVCETEQTELIEQPKQPDQKEPTPQFSASLSKKSKSLHQTDNLSCGQNIPAGSFEKIEQSNNSPLDDPYKTAQNVNELIDAWLTDPAAFADDFVPLVVREKIKWNRWVLPWHSGGRKLNNLYQNFNPVVVDFLAAELATKSKRSAQQEITHAVAVMNTWEKTKGGWTNLMQRLSQAHSAETQRLAQQQAIQTAHAAPDQLRAVLPEIRQARRFTKSA